MTLTRTNRAFLAGLILSLTLLISATATQTAARQNPTPEATWSCDDVMPQATPGRDHGGMDMGSPMAGDMPMHMDVDIDQMYIDMMIPHHASIIALAQAALPELTDPRLITIAESIISTQTAEIAELNKYREDLFGDREIMPMDEQTMGMMMDMMPVGTMNEMMFQMDPAAQVSAFRGAEDPDLAFIDMVIPHHEMAIVSPQAVIENGTHAEIVAFAERVIADQQAEIDELKKIRDDIATD